jgi:hypothetical protein
MDTWQISHRSFGDRGFIMQRTMSMKTPKSRDAKSRYNRDRQIKDEIWTVHLYGHVAARRPYRQFGVRDFIMQRTMSMKTPKSRDAKSRYNRDRQIKDEIWTVHLYGHVAARKPYRQFGVRDFIMQRTMKTKSPISRYAKSRRNLNRQINMRSRPSIYFTSAVHVTQGHVAQSEDDRCQADLTL